MTAPDSKYVAIMRKNEDVIIYQECNWVQEKDFLEELLTVFVQISGSVEPDALVLMKPGLNGAFDQAQNIRWLHDGKYGITIPGFEKRPDFTLYDRRNNAVILVEAKVCHFDKGYNYCVGNPAPMTPPVIYSDVKMENGQFFEHGETVRKVEECYSIITCPNLEKLKDRADRQAYDNAVLLKQSLPATFDYIIPTVAYRAVIAVWHKHCNRWCDLEYHETILCSL